MKTSPFDYGVYHFRRAFDLAASPRTLIVHVSADNRYELFANGERVSSGPARGDLHHWRYETVDLASHLHPGRNVLAAVVWNFGVHAPQAQVTSQTGFLLEGEGEAGKTVGTDRSWKALRDCLEEQITVATGRRVPDLCPRSDAEHAR